MELAKFLLEQPTIHDKGLYILSACFNQDSLESYFGYVRAAGGEMSIPQCRRY